MGKPGDVTPQRKIEFFEATQKVAPTFAARMGYWLASADRLAFKVALEQPSADDLGLFVVRLAGILSDLRHRYKPQNWTEDERAKGGFMFQQREKLRNAVIAAIAELYGLLTEDELLWLELRRHEQSHPVLDGYRAKLVGDESWDKRISAILDKREFTLDEINARCVKVEAQHGGYDGTAIAIAKRVFQHVRVVRNAMTTLLAGL